jgi:hypothetical protein
VLEFSSYYNAFILILLPNLLCALREHATGYAVDEHSHRLSLLVFPKRIHKKLATDGLVNVVSLRDTNFSCIVAGDDFAFEASHLGLGVSF